MNGMRELFINSIEDSTYPTSEYSYNPDFFYPEYPWGKENISKEKNFGYQMVRECLIGLKLDEENINSVEWNPLGKIIQFGDTVVLKPNWVMNFNKNKHVKIHSLDCLITHPSVLRAILDYCIIALKGSGRLIIGDAPMQGCDLDDLLVKSGYDKLFAFYNDHNVNLSPVDFRKYSVIVDKNKVLIGKKYTGSEGVEVDLSTKSRLRNIDGERLKYKVSDYNEKTTTQYHSNGRHSYLISKDVLSADVIINICKPKCHRLAGMTASIKNIVGITYDKVCLPHRTSGSVSEGGDEYLNKDFIKQIISKVLNLKMYFEEKNLLFFSLCMRYIYGVLYYIARSISKDKYLVGSWFGNDTIWRTSLDLYEIIRFADKNGKISDSEQRKIFNIADMIISGERNGPVSPEPKQVGMILAGFDGVFMDRVICEIMGFDYMKVPTIKNSINDSALSNCDVNKTKIFSNVQELNDKTLSSIETHTKWHFKPYDSWKGHIEL